MSSSSSAVEVYQVSTAQLIKLAGTDSILVELTGHTSMWNIKWPEQFIVMIDPESEDDTNGIKCYRDETDETPFLVMGYCHIGFYITLALLRAVGTKRDT